MGPTEIYGSEHFTETVGTKPTNAPFLRLRRKGGTLLEVLKLFTHMANEEVTFSPRLVHPTRNSTIKITLFCLQACRVILHFFLLRNELFLFQQTYSTIGRCNIRCMLIDFFFPALGCALSLSSCVLR